MANQAAQQDPLALIKIDDHTVVTLVNHIKELIVQYNKQDTTSMYLYQAMMTIIKLHSKWVGTSNDLQTVCNMLDIRGDDTHVLITTIENLTRRAACLSEIEEQYFTTTVQTPEGQSMQCPLDWHAQPEEYAAAFGTALQSRKEVSPIILLN